MRRIALGVALLALSGVGHAQGIDPESGLIRKDGYLLVKQQCTVCHSGALIVRSRATREGWQAMIRWMQEKQGLWPLGDMEAPILEYLARHYGPGSAGRRPQLPAELMPPS